MMRILRTNKARLFPAIAVVSLGALMLAAFVWLVFKDQEEERAAALLNAQTEAVNVANLLNEHLHQSIKRLDQALLHLRDAYAASPQDFIEKAHDWQKTVYGDLAFQISVVDADGWLLFSNLAVLEKPVDLSDRPHFRVHRDRPTDELYISPPVLGRVSQRWSIQFTRPLLRKNGAFNGTMVLSLDVDKLSDFYRSVDVGHHGVVTLVGDDRIVRAVGVNADGKTARPDGKITRADALAQTGETAPDLPFFAPTAPPGGRLTVEAKNGGDQRVGGYSRLAAYPLYIVVLYSKHDITDQLDHILRETAASAAVVGATIFLCVVVIAALMLRQATIQQGLAEARDRLAAAEERWRLALEAVGDGAWDWRVPDNKIYFSPRWRTMLGHGETESASGVEEWRARIHPDDREKALQDSEKLATGETPFYAAEYRIKNRDGGYRWVLARGIAVSRDDRGRAVRAVGTYADISERKAMEADLRAKSDALARSNQELEAFAYVASHDLRQPLRTINSYAVLLERELGKNISDDAQECVGFIRNGARRMDRLIVDLLEYSRVGNDPPPPAVIDMRQIINEATANLTAAVKDADARIDVAADLPAALGDEMQLLQLTQNLIGNAIKYCAPDRPPVVRVAADRHDDDRFIRFSVRDNGVGVAPEHFDRIFGIFQRLHSHHQVEGSGVGLAVCKKIVERHGGRIWLTSAPGRGSVFYFTLPAA